MTIRSASHTFEFQAGELQPPWVYRVFLGRKGGSEGGEVWPCHVFGLDSTTQLALRLPRTGL